jgi:prepilin-type N-terminal cleavage/methylation domain-containing protein
MKSKNGQRGFSLIELMTTLGIMSVFIMVIMNAQKSSMNSTGDLKRNIEINNLIQVLTSELSREDTCASVYINSPSPPADVNFKNKLVTRGSITSITNKNGNAIITRFTPYGSEVNILEISSAAGAGSHMNLTVNYQAVVKVGENAKPAEKFIIPINVFAVLDSFGVARINSCYSDLQTSLELAVHAACQGTGAKWYAADATYTFGHCEHEVELKNEAGGVITPVAGAFSCPVGQVLRNIDTTNNKMSFQCTTISTTTSCPAWFYLAGINADGSSNCVDVRTLFPNSGFMVIRSGVYSVQNIGIPICDTSKILQSINSDGSLNCINPRLSRNCPVNQFASGIDASGNVICSYSSDQNACSGGMYMKAIDSVGNVNCGYPTLTTSCGGGQVMTGIDASGAVICAANPP